MKMFQEQHQHDSSALHQKSSIYKINKTVFLAQH